jgi:lipoate-protein ligase A
LSLDRWSLQDDPTPRPGWYNMALDLALLDEAERRGEGFVRLYRWEPWCLSFGRHEPALRRYDRKLIERRGMDTVRRPTGGRAVWHARELTYAVAAPVTRFGSLAESYRLVHQAIAAAITSLGVPAEIAGPRPTPDVGAGACFATPAGGEVMTGGRKLVGSAQLRQGTAFLQHGSLLLGDDQRLIAEVTLGAAPVSGEITLSLAAGRTVPVAEAAAALAETVRAWDGRWRPFEDDAEALVRRHAAQFRDSAWTWKR